MRVTVKNADPHRTATVVQETFTPGGGPGSQAPARTLGPGTEESFYIHAGSRLLVTEDAEATIPKPA